MLSFFLILAVSAVFAEEKVNDVKIAVGESQELKTSKYPESEDLGSIVWNLSTEPGANIKLVCDDLRIAPTDFDAPEDDAEKRCAEGYVSIEGNADEPKVPSKICHVAYGLIARSKDNTLKVQFNLIHASGVMDCTAKAYKGEDTDDNEEQPPVDNGNDSSSSSSESKNES